MPKPRERTVKRSRRVTPMAALRVTLAIVSLGPLASAESTPLPNGPGSTVRATLQTRPGGPLEEVEVPVLENAAELTVAGAAEAQLDDDELVLGVVVEGRARAYPIRYLGRYEVLDDRLAGVAVAATWCPLTASGVVFGRRLGNRELSFDFVRGLIHDNLVISDRQTRSVWSQLQGRATSGPLADKTLDVLPSMQATWGFWKERHPRTEVLVAGESSGRAYRYFDADGEQRMPGLVGAGHDVDALGLGLQLWGQPAFFPLNELAKVPDPFTVGSGSQAIHIHHSQSGFTAWAENAAGDLLPGVLAYERGWRTFHPQSRIFDAAQATCKPTP